jgi:hypothetical protein
MGMTDKEDQQAGDKSDRQWILWGVVMVLAILLWLGLVARQWISK